MRQELGARLRWRCRPNSTCLARRPEHLRGGVVRWIAARSIRRGRGRMHIHAPDQTPSPIAGGRRSAEARQRRRRGERRSSVGQSSGAAQSSAGQSSSRGCQRSQRQPSIGLGERRGAQPIAADTRLPSPGPARLSVTPAQRA